MARSGLRHMSIFLVLLAILCQHGMIWYSIGLKWNKTLDCLDKINFSIEITNLIHSLNSRRLYVSFQFETLWRLVWSIFFLCFSFVLNFPVFAIKCWNCASDAEFCGDPFDENNVSDQEKRWSYIECTPPPPNQFDRRAVCKKVIQKGAYE